MVRLYRFFVCMLLFCFFCLRVVTVLFSTFRFSFLNYYGGGGGVMVLFPSFFLSLLFLFIVVATRGSLSCILFEFCFKALAYELLFSSQDESV